MFEGLQNNIELFVGIVILLLFILNMVIGLCIYNRKALLRQKRISDELEEKCQQMYHELFETLNQQQGLTFKVKKVNGQFVNTMAAGQLITKLGFSHEEILNRKLSEFLPAEMCEIAIPSNQKAWSGEVVTYEIALNDINVYIVLKPQYRNGEVVELIGSGIDVTELKQTQFQLAESAKIIKIAFDKVNKANQVKSEFLSKMSHELRTPLNSILGFSQILLDDKQQPLTRKQKDRIMKIEKSGKHLHQFISEILNLAKIEAGKLPIAIQKTNIFEDTKACIHIIEPLAAPKHITIKRAIHQLKTCSVMVDPLWFKQIILNLLSNAVKYNKQNGSVTIKSVVEKEYLVISIEDTGIGIPSESMDDIFEPFYRLNMTNDEGYGFGLPLVKQLVTLMNGNFGVKSEEGVGSCFWFSLPVADHTCDYDVDKKVFVY